MKVLAALFPFVVYAVSLSTATECEPPVFEESVDWDLLNSKGPFYDTINIGIPPIEIDCFDWVNFTNVDDGGIATVRFWAYGDSGSGHLMKVHFQEIEGRKGVYTLNPERKHEFHEAATKAVKHKATEQMVEDLNRIGEAWYELDYFIITDYENYYSLTACIRGMGLASWVKMKNQKPELKDAIRVLNAFADHGLSGHVFENDICIAREHDGENGNSVINAL